MSISFIIDYWNLIYQQDSVRRLGVAILDDDDEGDGLFNPKKRTGQGGYPDLIPKATTPQTAALDNKEKPLKSLPPRASPSRKVLLEAVNEVLGKRISVASPTNKILTEPQQLEEIQVKEIRQEEVTTTSSIGSHRVALFHHRHQEEENEIERKETNSEKLSRFVCEQLPSVSFEANHRPQSVQRHQQHISVAVFDDNQPQSSPMSMKLETAKKEDEQETNLNQLIQPDDLARLVCDLLCDQVHLAIDSFAPPSASVPPSGLAPHPFDPLQQLQQEQVNS